MKRARPIVAIDGPGGAGKSTVARALAKALGFTYLNTGAMYRAVALAFRGAGIKRDDPRLDEHIAPILKSIEIGFDGDRVILNGRDVSAQLGTPEITELASAYSAIAPVRARMRELQRKAGAEGGVVMEGRDIGTVVFPDAEFKVYLDADSTVRAERRYGEMSRNDISVKRDQVLRELIQRDRRDSAREHAPLRRAADAMVIDTTNMSIEQVVSALRERLQELCALKRA